MTGKETDNMPYNFKKAVERNLQASVSAQKSRHFKGNKLNSKSVVSQTMVDNHRIKLRTNKYESVELRDINKSRRVIDPYVVKNSSDFPKVIKG